VEKVPFLFQWYFSPSRVKYLFCGGYSLKRPYTLDFRNTEIALIFIIIGWGGELVLVIKNNKNLTHFVNFMLFVGKKFPICGAKVPYLWRVKKNVTFLWRRRSFFLAVRLPNCGGKVPDLWRKCYQIVAENSLKPL